MAAQLPSSQEWQELRTFDEPFCVTVYMPPIDPDGTGSEDPERIGIKNLLRQAETVLLDEGVDPGIVSKTLRPAWKLLDSPDFRPLRSEGMALFAHPQLFRFYHLPADLPLLVSIGRGFQLDPLQDATRDNRRYLVLALSHNNVRMFEGDRFGIRQLRLKNFPSNMEKSLGIDEYPKSIQTHPVAAGGEKGSESFHGQYNEQETDKDMLFLFFRKIDASLRKFLQRKDEPLVLAGVGYLLPIYRRANTSPYLVPGGLVGNVERVRPDTIRKRAWSLIKQVEGTA